jgi:hypothetical protein
MTPKPSHLRSRKGHANARLLRKIETTADADEIAQSLIETFPASDPPAWVPLVRVGIPKRRAKARRPPNERHRR